MIYFDNAATSFPKPPAVGQAMSKFLAEDSANPGRAGHRMAVAAEQMLDDVRLKLTRLVGGDDFQRMIFTLNCTDALNMAIKGVISDLSCGNKDKPHVITTVLEHNSVSRPLAAMATRGRIELTRVACDAAGFIDPQDIADAITPATALVVMTHASNVLGTIQDAAAVGQIARAHDVLFCLDAAQTIGVVEIDVEKLQVDLLAFPGHKSLLGPTGIGGLYVGARCKHLSPWREGGTGGDFPHQLSRHFILITSKAARPIPSASPAWAQPWIIWPGTRCKNTWHTNRPCAPGSSSALTTIAALPSSAPKTPRAVWARSA